MRYITVRICNDCPYFRTHEHGGSHTFSDPTVQVPLTITDHCGLVPMKLGAHVDQREIPIGCPLPKCTA